MSDIVDELRLMRDGAQWACGATAATLGQAADEIEWLRKERCRLAADLAKAHKDILPWIENVRRFSGDNSKYIEALRRIGMPGKNIAYCRDGHEIAVLTALDALRGYGHED